MSAFTRWRFGMNLRLVMAVMCVPMPPCFLGLPLRQIILPLIGRFPVNSQILAIRSLINRQQGSGFHLWRKAYLLIGAGPAVSQKTTRKALFVLIAASACAAK